MKSSRSNAACHFKSQSNSENHAVVDILIIDMSVSVSYNMNDMPIHIYIYK